MENVTKKKKRMSKQRILFILFCVTVPVIHWLVFYVYINFSSILMAFTDKDGAFSLENYVRFFEEFGQATSTIRLAFRNTMLTFAVQFVVFPFSVLVSYFIYKKIPFYGFYRIVFFLPIIIFSVAWSLVFTRVIGVEGAIAQGVQKLLGLDYTPELLADSQFANTTVILHKLWMGFAGDLIIWGGAFARIPEDVLESARVDGVTWWQEFTRIIVPMIWPTVALQMVMLFCGIFGASGDVFLLTGGEYNTMTLSAWMFIQLKNGSGDLYRSNIYNYMSAVGMIITVVAIVISLSVRKFTDRVFEEVEY